MKDLWKASNGFFLGYLQLILMSAKISDTSTKAIRKGALIPLNKGVDV